MDNISLATKPLGVSSTINGFYMYVNFSFDQSIPGKTTINWSSHLGTGGGGYNATSSSAAAELIMRITNIKGSSSASTITAVPWKSSGYYNFKTQGSTAVSSGSFVYTHDNEGKGSFSIAFDANIGGYKDSFVDATHEVVLTDNIPYTKCGAPTSVKASGYITPSGTFTVSWSGATAGHANAISGYRVYYSLTKEGTAPTIETKTYKDVNALTSSTTFTLSNADRKWKVVCGVVAKGSVSGYDSDIKTGGNVIINSQPGVPNVSVDKTIVPSTGGEVEFTIEAGSDANSSQTRTVYYSTSATGSKKQITTTTNSTWSQTIEATTTYYFWTYDGLEYSNLYVSKTIEKNTKPEITNVAISGPVLASINANTSYEYRIAPKITVTSENGQSSKSYEYYIDYGTSISSLNSRKDISTSDSATSKIISDIRTYGLGHEDSGVFYKITVKCNDGVEDSAEKSSDIYYITKVPSLQFIYNNSGFTNIDGFSDGNFATHYSKFLGFVFERDEGYKILKFKDYNSGDKEINLNTNESDTRGSWNDSNELNSSVYYNLSYQIGYSKDYMASVKDKYITKIGTVILSNFIFSLKDQYYKFFTDELEYENTVGHSYGNSPLISGSIKDFGIKETLTSNHFYGKIKSNDSWTEAINLSPNQATSDNTIGFILSAQAISNALTSLFTESQKNKAYDSTFYLYIKNDFGDEVSINSDFYVDFRENDNITLDENSAICPNKSNENLNNWLYLKEGMGPLIGNFRITSYNTNPKGEIQIKRSTENNWQTLNNFTFFKEDNSSATPGNPVVYFASGIKVQPINEISSNSYTASYRLVVTTDTGLTKTIELYKDIPIKGHIPATLVIQNHSYKDSNLTIAYSIINSGADTKETNLILTNKEVNLYLDGQKNAKAIYIDNSEDYFSNDTKTATFNGYDFAGAESNLVKLGISTTLYTYLKTDTNRTNPCFGTTKTTILESITSTPIFNILPTVAYRKNHLGINVLEPDVNSNAIIVIGEASGRDTIYFQPANNNSCKVVNFLINCGEWT